ncbi:MAG: hypothetical protein QM784_05575 [Polyangiaceae bacterium]
MRPRCSVGSADHSQAASLSLAEVGNGAKTVEVLLQRVPALRALDLVGQRELGMDAAELGEALGVGVVFAQRSEFRPSGRGAGRGERAAGTPATNR